MAQRRDVIFRAKQPFTVSGAGWFSTANRKQRARIPPERALVLHA
jgi:hypothetical protein